MLFFVTIVVAILRVAARCCSAATYAAVNAIAGASSQDEEIEGELKGLGIETPHGGKQ